MSQLKVLDEEPLSLFQILGEHKDADAVAAELGL